VDAARVAKAREAIFTLGVYGPVSVIASMDGRFPYIDNLVNLLVAEDLGAGADGGSAACSSCRMGLRCSGKVGSGRRRWKTKSAALDEWTHYYYDAKGNAVSKDKQVGPPRTAPVGGQPALVAASRPHVVASAPRSPAAGALLHHGRRFANLDPAALLSGA